ncbi:P-loop containing nucleoside triphosphate hydrolase protein [Jimgerdemannia flammicorona]|uniref:P-loop containing nucleoside triphosphate hydrolase protein n=1 Tax=Jimgerdemannia flammicorona TaxID=994334 RepID=A0A433AUF2_9FUNG|nr:P-loop containing nucleoside triphosphate hydrolase protein [Jimgerdemannia flammicorona]
MSNPPKVRKIAVLGSRSVGKSSLTIQFCDNHFVDSYYPTIEATFNKVIKYRGQEFATEIIDTAGQVTCRHQVRRFCISIHRPSPSIYTYLHVQDEYSIMNSRHAIGIHGYVFVYSITSRSSLEMIKIIRDKILNFTGTDNVPAVLVGNKCDLHIQRWVVVARVSEGREDITRIYCLLSQKVAGWEIVFMLTHSFPSSRDARQVTPEEGKELAAQWNCLWVEASAKHNENIGTWTLPIIVHRSHNFIRSHPSFSSNLVPTHIDRIFDLMIAEVEKSNNPPTEPSGNCVLS